MAPFRDRADKEPPAFSWDSEHASRHLPAHIGDMGWGSDRAGQTPLAFVLQNRQMLGQTLNPVEVPFPLPFFEVCVSLSGSPHNHTWRLAVG